MKKKRIKFGLAILGGLAAFLLALLELVFAPTLASAGKGIDTWHDQDGGGHSGYHNPVYFAPPNETGSGNGPQHGGNGAGPCAGTLCDRHNNGAPGDGAWHAGGPGDGHDGGHGNDQGGSPNNDSGNNSQGGSPWQSAGGYPGGGGGGSYGPHGKPKSCPDEKDKDAKSDDKACDDDSNNIDDGFQSFTLLSDKDGDPSDDSTDAPSDDTNGNPPNNFRNDDPPGDDDDLPPVDPNCFPFTENCGTHDGNPPNTVVTDQPTEVPEPLTLSLFAVGLTGVAAMRRRQKAIAQPD